MRMPSLKASYSLQNVTFNVVMQNTRKIEGEPLHYSNDDSMRTSNIKIQTNRIIKRKVPSLKSKTNIQHSGDNSCSSGCPNLPKAATKKHNSHKVALENDFSDEENETTKKTIISTDDEVATIYQKGDGSVIMRKASRNSNCTQPRYKQSDVKLSSKGSDSQEIDILNIFDPKGNKLCVINVQNNDVVDYRPASKSKSKERGVQATEPRIIPKTSNRKPPCRCCRSLYGKDASCKKPKPVLKSSEHHHKSSNGQSKNARKAEKSGQDDDDILKELEVMHSDILIDSKKHNNIINLIVKELNKQYKDINEIKSVVEVQQNEIEVEVKSFKSVETKTKSKANIPCYECDETGKAKLYQEPSLVPKGPVPLELQPYKSQSQKYLPCGPCDEACLLGAKSTNTNSQFYQERGAYGPMTFKEKQMADVYPDYDYNLYKQIYPKAGDERSIVSDKVHEAQRQLNKSLEQLHDERSGKKSPKRDKSNRKSRRKNKSKCGICGPKIEKAKCGICDKKTKGDKIMMKEYKTSEGNKSKKNRKRDDKSKSEKSQKYKKCGCRDKSQKYKKCGCREKSGSPANKREGNKSKKDQRRDNKLKSENTQKYKKCGCRDKSGSPAKKRENPKQISETNSEESRKQSKKKKNRKDSCSTCSSEENSLSGDSDLSKKIHRAQRKLDESVDLLHRLKRQKYEG